MKIYQSSKTRINPEASLRFVDSALWLVMLAFFISYIFFFIKPVFLNAEGQMVFKNFYTMSNIGWDLEIVLRQLGVWWRNGASPYSGSQDYWYPPFGTLMFTPLLFVNFSLAYSILTLLTVVCYMLSTIFIPLLMTKDIRQVTLPFIVLFSVSGMFSYGFHLELERGQFNVIVFFLCILAIYLYHKDIRYHYVSCCIIVVATQLKIYPMIFVLMLVKDWRDWRSNLKLIVAFTILNALCFFIMGTSVFLDFFNQLYSNVSNPDFYVWAGNHCIKSFSCLAPKNLQKVIPISEASLIILGWFFYVFLLLLFGVAFATILWTSRIKHRFGMNTYLLLGCALGACLMPTASMDYKLPMLTTPVLMCLLSIELNCSMVPMWFRSSTILIVAFAYFSTLYSYSYKPIWISNNTPMLMVILINVAVYSFWSKLKKKDTDV